MFDQTIKLSVVVGSINPGPPLAPILGQYDIKPPADFITKLNQTLNEIEKDTPVSLSVHRSSKTKQYKIIVNGPTTMALLDNLSKGTSRKREYLEIQSLWDLVRIKYSFFKHYRGSTNRVELKNFSSIVLGSLESAKVFVKI
jgi:ribosomal protein L11